MDKKRILILSIIIVFLILIIISSLYFYYFHFLPSKTKYSTDITDLYSSFSPYMKSEVDSRLQLLDCIPKEYYYDNSNICFVCGKIHPCFGFGWVSREGTKKMNPKHPIFLKGKYSREEELNFYSENIAKLLNCKCNGECICDSGIKARTEDYVQSESTKYIKGKKGLAIVNFPIRDTERLLTFYNTAVSNDRTLVLEYRQAMLLDILRQMGIENLPKSNDENIRIFYPKKSWGLVGRDDFPEEQIKQDYGSWEKDFLDRGNIIVADEIKKKQQEYVMFMNYFQLNNLLDIKPIEGSVHIRSVCEPFSEDMELDQKRIDNWLRLFGLYPEQRIHSSGHACGPAIFDMIRKINPKLLFPIHTLNPAAFKELSGIDVVFPEYGKKITF